MDPVTAINDLIERLTTIQSLWTDGTLSNEPKLFPHVVISLDGCAERIQDLKEFFKL